MPERPRCRKPEKLHHHCAVPYWHHRQKQSYPHCLFHPPSARWSCLVRKILLSRLRPRSGACVPTRGSRMQTHTASATPALQLSTEASKGKTYHQGCSSSGPILTATATASATAAATATATAAATTTSISADSAYGCASDRWSGAHSA